MRLCVQRVRHAKVTLVETGAMTGKIGQGLLVFLGIKTTDTDKEARFLAEKVATLRIFEDKNGKMNLGLAEIGGQMLVVSQFTLYGDCRKGRRPGFIEAARPEKAIPLYSLFINEVRKQGIIVATGEFQQEMAVELVNDGPVTLILDCDAAET